VSGLPSFLGVEGYAASTFVLCAVFSLLAGLARGFSGFGAALIFVPPVSAVIGPQLAAPLILIIDTILAAAFMPRAWPIANKREVATIAIGSAVGVPLGAMVLARADPISIRWMIVAIVLPMLALLVSGWRYHREPAPSLTVGVGALSGVLSGIAQVGGPPVAMYWLGRAQAGGIVRANILIYSIASAAIAILVYSFGGLMVRPLIGLALVTAPAYGIGLWLGAHLFGFASEAAFRRVCYALIAGAVIFGLPVFDGLLR
jgi:uncharacterized membrane protein YfcA